MGVVARGEIWWIDFGAAFGSEPAKRRPALVVSDDRFNRSRLATVAVVALTSNTRLADRPGNVLLSEGTAGLDRSSVVNVTQLATVDRRRLIQRAGMLPPPDLRRVENGLRLALHL